VKGVERADILFSVTTVTRRELLFEQCVKRQVKMSEWRW